MKWTNELKDQLTELAFEEKSNKEISEIMCIPLGKVHEGRSRFGITVAKVAAAKKNLPVIRTKEVIQEELKKVQKARTEAYKKIKKCDGRIQVLEDELDELEEQKCRVCGCTWNNACLGGCYWVEDNLCSACVGR